ncbi:MAG TPA: hypothetical protein VHG93_12235 [Longimicrobium sp.]|nr:hypothetical protein [Longimicrobium sp.]
MRTLIGLILTGAAGWALAVGVLLLTTASAARRYPEAHPLPLPPWYVLAGWFAAAAIAGWMGVRLLNRGILGRLVRGRGFTPPEQ